jgi:hypothetical protein
LLWHTVSFYDDGIAHVQSLVELVTSGLQAGHAVIVIATPHHRDALLKQLEAAPGDIAAGALVMLDAQQTLDAISTGGKLSRQLFREHIGTIITSCLERFSAVDAYGEMVALLWEREDINGALELETLWNSLHRTIPFSLRCAYPVLDAALHPLLGAHAPVCALHNAVV